MEVVSIVRGNLKVEAVHQLYGLRVSQFLMSYLLTSYCSLNYLFTNSCVINVDPCCRLKKINNI